MKPSDFVKYLQRMIALTDTGLTFTKDPFDRERYEDLRSLLSEMLNQGSDLDVEEVAEVLKPTSAYATPLMDVRAWIVEDEKICLVRGQGEDSWALPGGWSEIWETSRTMGRCNRRNWRSSGLWIFSLYRYIIKMKAKFYEGYILYYSLHFSNLSYLSIHKYLR